MTDRQQTDRQQTTDRHFWADPYPYGKFFFIFFIFFCIWEGEKEWGEIYTFLLATQVRFAHLLRSQGEKILFNIQSEILRTRSAWAGFKYCDTGLHLYLGRGIYSKGNLGKKLLFNNNKITNESIKISKFLFFGKWVCKKGWKFCAEKIEK